MEEVQEFWSVDCPEGEPDLLVCIECLGEVYRSKVPKPACPACGATSTFEPFSLDSIREWGTDELIQKAEKASSEARPAVPSHDVDSVSGEQSSDQSVA